MDVASEPARDWTALLRQGDWLGAKRVRAYAIMLLIAYAGMLVPPFRDAMLGPGSDFLAFWAAAKLTVAGTPQLAYDLAAETAMQAATGIRGMFAYVNPPPFLLVIAPLGLLPYAAAWLVWSLAGWAVWLLAGRRWIALAAGAASAAALSLLSLAVFGADTWRAWPDSFAVSATIMRDGDAVFWQRMGTIYSAMRLYGGPQAALIAQAFVTLICAAMVVLAWGRSRDVLATGALLLAATALGSPYLFAYDLAFLALPVFWLVREGLARGFRSWERMGIVALYFAPLAARAAALPLGINLTPLVAAALAALVWTRLAEASVTTSAPTPSPKLSPT